MNTRRLRPVTIIISTSSRIFGQTFFVHWGPFNPWKLDNCCEERELQLAAAMSDQRIPSTHHSPLLLILNSQNFCWQHSRTRLHLLNQTRTKLSDLKLGWGGHPQQQHQQEQNSVILLRMRVYMKMFFLQISQKKKKSKSLFCVVGYKLQLYFCLLTLFKTLIIVACYRYLKSVCDKE